MKYIHFTRVLHDDWHKLKLKIDIYSVGGNLLNYNINYIYVQFNICYKSN